jgi:hypothetical protein
MTLCLVGPKVGRREHVRVADDFSVGEMYASLPLANQLCERDHGKRRRSTVGELDIHDLI